MKLGEGFKLKLRYEFVLGDPELLELGKIELEVREFALCDVDGYE